MAIPNCNSRNPFLDQSSSFEHAIKPESPTKPEPLIPSPSKAELDLLVVAKKGIALVTAVTKYLSTLPHPIEIVEELVAVCAVTSTLLTSLHATIERFPHLRLSTTCSFVVLLCQDVLFGFRLLGSKVDEARRARVFEPNANGLVRMPSVAWAMVLGGEGGVAALRSRLYVEKYRVRVLIETVSWSGLRSVLERMEREQGEMRGLEGMLPLIAERMVGIQRDYAPRLRALRGLGPVAAVSCSYFALKSMAASQEVKSEQPKPAVLPIEKTDSAQEKESLRIADSKVSIHSSTSTDSLASTSSSSTAIDDSILETWLLRYQTPRHSLSSIKRSTCIFGIPISSTESLTPGYFYVKPVASCPSEISDLRKQCQGKDSESEHKKVLERKVLGMKDEAQWEIQKLLEAREKASEGPDVRRSWGVVGFMERPARCINEAASGKGWKRKMGLGKREEVEWVLVIKGETVDTRCRVLPVKHADPWRPAPVRAVMSVPVPIQQRQVQQQQQASMVLRHVENKRAMSAEEAREKMEEIVGELFIVKD